MKSNILGAVFTVVCNQAGAMVLCFLMGIGALTTAPTGRKWKAFGANMTQVFGGNFTEVTAPSILACVALASRSPPVNLACYLPSRCIFASVFLPYFGGEQTEGYSCLFSQACIYEGALLNENETVPDPLCSESQVLQCTKQGMVVPGLPPARTACTAPFEQHSFGCMYPNNFTGTYCEARRYCQELGANLASPKTVNDSIDMCAYYNNLHGKKEYYYVGLFLKDGVWRWPENQREASPPKTGEWAPSQPTGGEHAAVMYPYANYLYKIGDVIMNETHKVICHVWNVY